MLKTLLALSAILSPFEIDRAALQGEWVGATSEDPAQNHSYFRLEASQTGRFVLVARGREIVNFEFSEDQITDQTGYLEIVQEFEGWGVKVLLSGMKSEVDHGFGTMNGLMFMYKTADDYPELFNTIYIRLWAVDGPVPDDRVEESALDKVREQYGSSE